MEFLKIWTFKRVALQYLVFDEINLVLPHKASRETSDNLQRHKILKK